VSEILNYINEQVAAIKSVEARQLKSLADDITRCSEEGGILWIAGNGGSATTAAHFATDLSKGCFVNNDVQIRAICLNEFLGVTTAWANDFGFEDALGNQLRSLAHSKDYLMIISGSGNSENLIRLANQAKRMQIKIVTLLGMGGGRLKGLGKTEVIINSNDMQVVETTHVHVLHAIFKIMTSEKENC
jgi:D-sedoheptulose 7-phosphate isomerase